MGYKINDIPFNFQMCAIAPYKDHSGRFVPISFAHHFQSFDVKITLFFLLLFFLLLTYILQMDLLSHGFNKTGVRACMNE